MEDIHLMNRMVGHLRSTAQRPLILWKIKPSDMSFIAGSDAGGVGSLPDQTDPDGLVSDGTQGAWMVLLAETLPSGTEKVKVFPITWRSCKLKRRVPSTLAVEALSLSQSVAEVEFLQVLMRDVLDGDVSGDWAKNLSPFVITLGQHSEMCHAPHAHVVDAKSVYDMVKKELLSSKQDKRIAIELAIVIEALRRVDARIRWVPHFKMFCDSLTQTGCRSQLELFCTCFELAMSNWLMKARSFR